MILAAVEFLRHVPEGKYDAIIVDSSDPVGMPFSIIFLFISWEVGCVGVYSVSMSRVGVGIKTIDRLWWPNKRFSNSGKILL